MKIDMTFGEKEEGKHYYDREGVYLIVVRDGKAAVVKTEKGYFLIGGGLEGSRETHEECIRRECMEETGYEVIVKKYLCSAEEYQIHEKSGYFHPVQHYYVGELTNKIKTPQESDHHLEWIPVENIEEKMHVQIQAWAVKYYLK